MASVQLVRFPVMIILLFPLRRKDVRSVKQNFPFGVRVRYEIKESSPLFSPGKQDSGSYFGLSIPQYIFAVVDRVLVRTKQSSGVNTETRGHYTKNW